MLPRRVSGDMNAFLIREPDMEEITKAIQQMATLKAPSPDGFLASFYQENWENVKGEVCNAISSFFNSGSFDKSINKTYIALIQSIHYPTKVMEFRPISLYNVLFIVQDFV